MSFLPNLEAAGAFYGTNNYGDIMGRFTNDVDAVGEMLNNHRRSHYVQRMSQTYCLMVYANISMTLITVLMVLCYGSRPRFCHHVGTRFYR